MDLLSGQPFWFYKNGILNSYPALQKHTRTDVIVMGGGVTGALVADRLVEAGLDVVIVEKRHVGLGSTSGSTALLQYEIDTDLHELAEMVGEEHAVRCYQRCVDAIDMVHDLATELDQNADFSYRPSLYYASAERELPKLERELEARRAAGIEVEWWDKETLRGRFPGIQKGGAIYSKAGGQIDVFRLTHGLIQKRLGNGLRVYDGAEAKDIAHTQRSVTVTLEGGQRIRAGHLVVACGYESQNYLERKVTRLHSSYAIVSKPMPELKPLWPDECLIWESARPYLYMRTTADSRVLIGGKDEVFSSAIQRDRLLNRKAKQLEGNAQSLLPHLPFVKDFEWCGTFAETKDGLPYVGQSDERQRTYFAMGFGGNGILYSTLAGGIIRDGILGQKNDDAELFSFDRRSS